MSKPSRRWCAPRDSRRLIAECAIASRDVEQVAELDGRKPFGVPGARVVVELQSCGSAPSTRDRVAGGLHLRANAVDAAARLHAPRHLIAQDRQPLGTAVGHNQRQHPVFDVLRLALQASAIGAAATLLANAAALMPATLPNTPSSESEFDPSRLAP